MEVNAQTSKEPNHLIYLGPMENGTVKRQKNAPAAQGRSRGQRQDSHDVTSREDIDADENTRMINNQQEGGAGDYMSMDSSSSDLRKTRNKGRRNSAAKRRKPRMQNDQDQDSASIMKAGNLGHWWKHVMKGFANVELDNEGSVARDHLALGKR